MTPETRVKKKVMKLLSDVGAYAVPQIMTGYGRAGVPDILACVSGKFFAIECKATDKERLTAPQAMNLSRARVAGATAVVVCDCNFKDFDSMIKNFVLHGGTNLAYQLLYSFTSDKIQQALDAAKVTAESPEFN